MTDTGRVEFLDYKVAFPTLSREHRELGISGGKDAGSWEFMVQEIAHRGFERRDGIIGIRVKVFDDAWQAYADIPEFFTALTTLSAAHPRDGMGGHSNGQVTFEDVIALCRDLGYYDKTPEYADRHVHQYRCACGAYPEETHDA